MTEELERRTFRTKRMENAYYWAAQARGFLDTQIIGVGVEGEWYVEILGGKVTLVFSDEFPEGGIDALELELRGHGFPDEWTRRELDEETRIFMIPNDDRLHSNYDDDWRHFEGGSYGGATDDRH